MFEEGNDNDKKTSAKLKGNGVQCTHVMTIMTNNDEGKPLFSSSLSHTKIFVRNQLNAQRVIYICIIFMQRRIHKSEHVFLGNSRKKSVSAA